jgi:hypothetical protein
MATPSVTPPAGRSYASSAKRFFLIAVSFILIVALGTMAFLMYASYGDGYRVGTILKLSRKGVVFKTWEGELSQGFLEPAVEAGAGVATRIWYFTVNSNDPQVITQLDHAIEGNKKVKLFYKEKYTILPWIGDTRQIVYKVEEVQ